MEDDNEEVGREDQEVSRLANLPVEELLERAHRALIKRLLVRIENGTATKDDIAQLRQLLKDNGMTYPEMSGGGTGVVKDKVEPAELPELEDPDYE